MMLRTLCVLAISLTAACGTEKAAKKLLPVPGPAAPDSHSGTYAVGSHTSSAGRCDVQFPLTDDRKISYFQLATYSDIFSESTDLWLHRCTDAENCGEQEANFVFYDKVDPATWHSISSKYNGPDLTAGYCLFGYTERVAQMQGENIVIHTSYYADSVPALGNGICLSHNGGNRSLDDYYAAYAGNIPCESKEVITAARIATEQ